MNRKHDVAGFRANPGAPCRFFASGVFLDRKRGAFQLLGLVLGSVVALSSQVRANDIGSGLAQVAPFQQPRPTMSPLSRSEEPVTSTRETSGTGFFVDDVGHLLTARHAAENCARLIVVKEGRAVVAHLVALSPSVDLALLKIPRTLGLAAVFPEGAGVGPNDMVFASAYDTLPAHRGMLANATVAADSGSRSGALMIDSDVTFGASGAPVLDGRGLVQGIISRKIGSSRVVAVGATEAKGFLAANGVRFAKDDRAQIAAASARSGRAGSISVKVVCSLT